VSFPFKTYRTGQREAIDAANDAFEAGKRFVIIEAPTGSGKSAIAVALTRDASSAYVLTAQKILQHQYVNDFPELALVKGRSNYPCEINPLTNASAAPCFLRYKDVRCENCKYFAAKENAMAAGSVVTNYAYYLAELNYSGGFEKRDLLILDEAHNAEASLMQFLTVTLSESDVMRYGLEGLPPFIEDDSHYFEYLETLLPDLWDLHGQTDTALKKASDPTGPVALDIMRRRAWLSSQFQGIERIVNSRNEDDIEWTVESKRAQRGTTLTFKPVTVASFAEELLFKHGARVLMLSATILDAPTYLRGLGVAEEDATVIDVPSSFPAEKRPIYVQPVTKLTRHYLKDGLPKLTRAISELMDSHANDKGLIHTHSYKIASAIRDSLPKKQQQRLITHDSSSGRDDALERHCNSKAPTVLLTPSMTEGIDLAGDLSRWQIICKIPYPYLGDPQVARRKERDPAWYDWHTTLTVVQAYGRSIRSEDDYAVTYLLDADFPSFLKRQKRRLPSWFLEAVQG
jgi:Rad3-related DNA helicase